MTNRTSANFPGEPGHEGLPRLHRRHPDEARKIAKADPPDLIILDFQIEESDGFVLIDEFRKLYPKIPLMLLTGAVFGTGAVREAIEKKVASYLDKTASLSQILDEIQRLIGDPESSAAK